MIGLDTNVLVRYLAQDDPKQSVRATRLIEKELSAEEPGFLTVIALVETVWVLETCYEATREEIGVVLERLLRVKQVELQEPELVAQAVRRFRAEKGDFADHLLSRLGIARGCSETVTFDKGAVSIEGMRLLEND